MQTLKEITTITLIIIVAIVVGGLTLKAIGSAFDRQAKGECEIWQKQANIFPNYYLLEWQKGQCDALGININATVK